MFLGLALEEVARLFIRHQFFLLLLHVLFDEFQHRFLHIFLEALGLLFNALDVVQLLLCCRLMLVRLTGHKVLIAIYIVRLLLMEMLHLIKLLYFLKLLLSDSKDVVARLDDFLVQTFELLFPLVLQLCLFFSSLIPLHCQQLAPISLKL